MSTAKQAAVAASRKLGTTADPALALLEVVKLLPTKQIGSLWCTRAVGTVPGPAAPQP